MFKILFLVTALVVFLIPANVQAHRSGCHRWHSCPSDTGSYTCGDLGYYSGCPSYPVTPVIQTQTTDAPTPQPTIRPTARPTRKPTPSVISATPSVTPTQIPSLTNSSTQKVLSNEKIGFWDWFLSLLGIR